ncbi:MAG: discoidin domain-containing protein [Lachnospiraceae bacterium]
MKFWKKMLSIALAASISVTALPVSLGIPMVKAADKTVIVRPTDASPFNNGEFQGWGTSLCWWANRVGYDETLTDLSTKALFSLEEGLGMTIGRYNIGGGDDPEHNHITRSDSKIPGYLELDEEGNRVYNWEADQNQRNVLNKAIEYAGGDMIAEAFSNSPPYMMTNSGCSSGAESGSSDNLKSDEYTNFANYLAEVCDHFDKEWGIRFQSVAPMNEPDTSYWSANSVKQEGCHFSPGTSQSKIIEELDQALKEKNLDNIIISGTDETSIDTQINSYNKLSDAAKNVVQRIDTHTYSGSKRSELKSLAETEGKNLWMSEVDGGSTAGSSAGDMSGALWLAQRIITDMNGMMPSAWILWNAIDAHQDAAFQTPDGTYSEANTMDSFNFGGGHWGFGVADHDNKTIQWSKKYYAFGQFSKFIRPGYTIIASDASNLAAMDKKTGTIVIVAMNTSGSEQTVAYDLSEFASVGDTAQVTRTSGSLEDGENWAKLSGETLNGKQLEVTLKENSVTTFVIPQDSGYETLYYGLKTPKKVGFVGETVQMEVDTDAENVAETSWKVTEADGTETEKASITSTGALFLTKSGTVKVTATLGSLQSSVLITIIGEEDYVTIKNKKSGLLLDTVSHGKDSGTALVQWENLNYSSSQWKLVRVSGSSDGYNIVHRKSGYYLSAVDGQPVITSAADASSAAAQWQIVEVASGYYKIVNLSASKVLNVSGASTSNGGNVILYSYGGGENEMWSIDLVTTEPEDPREDMISITSDMVTGTSSYNNTNPYTNAVDGNNDTFFDGLTDGYVQIDLGKKYKLTQISFAPRVNYEYRMRDASFYGSNDGESWTKLYTIVDAPEFKTNDIRSSEWEGDTDEYRYIKYQVPSGTNNYKPNGASESYCCNIAEISLYGTEVVEPEPFEKLERTGWSATANSSHSGSANQPSNVLDGDSTTIWQASYNATDMTKFDPETNPYMLTINMGTEITFSRVDYLPRPNNGQDGDMNGVFTKYEIHISNDGSDWTHVASGEWSYDYTNRNHSERYATFAPVTAQYMRIIVRKNACRQDQAYAYYATAAEINLSQYTGGNHPMDEAKAALAETKVQVNELSDSERKSSLLNKITALEATGTVESINAFIEDTQSLLNLYAMMEEGVNLTYFQRLEQLLIDSDYSEESMSRMKKEIEGFQTLGKDIAEPVVTDLDDEYMMSDEDAQKTLIVRLKEANIAAKAKIAANPDKDYKMLKELVAYTEDVYKEDGYYHPYGLDDTSCEYVVNNIKFALQNLEKIENGEIDRVTSIKSGTTWLDDQGSKISANGGQIITGHDGKYYWYGEDNKLGYDLRTGVSCYSSTDLMNWTYEGLAFEAFKNDTEQSRKFADDLLTDNILGTKGRIERPKVIYNEKTQKYIMWMHLENNGGYGLSLAGVAISDYPTHGFEWLHYGYPVYDKSVTYNQNARQTFRDMNLFVDKDGTAYVYYASEGNPTMYAVRLNDEYTWIDSDGIVASDLYYADTMTEATGGETYQLPSFTEKQLYVSATDAINLEGSTIVHEDGRWSRVIYLTTGSDGIEKYREAPAPIRIGDTYYLVTSGCSGWKANAVMAFEAKSPLGPYVRQNQSLMTGSSTDGSPASTSFNSQSTCILKVGNEYMYMGDRWKNADYNHATSSIKRSTYIWLPMDISEDGVLSVSWSASWTFSDGEMTGDVNRDGKVDQDDMMMILDYATQQSTLTILQQEIADCNLDGKVSAVDALCLLHNI